MPASYFLKCLGLPELRGPDGKPIRFRVKKHLALLVYLAVVRRGAHPRDRLVDLLWPNAAHALGRHSLATALSVLRAIFGRAAFPTTRRAVCFSPLALSLDLDRLEAGQILSEGEADLDVDGFLWGFELLDAPDFDLWREREHARRLPTIHAGLLTLIDHARRRGDHARIAQHAERLLAVDELAEEGIRARMEAFALVGDRVGALRVYEDWRDRLRAELGAEPSAMLEGMATRLRARSWDFRRLNAAPSPSPVPAEQWRDRRFVGRVQEYQQLYEAWEKTHQFDQKHFLISGDSGVGKTTLAQRLVTAATMEGVTVSRVQCYQLEQKIPFSAIGGLVTGLLGRPGLAATDPQALAEVAKIVPAIREKFAALPPHRRTEGETARLHFAEGVLDLLRALLDEHPVLLVIDDFHLADEASLSVLHLIMRRLDQGRFMVVLTARSAELAEASQARRIREGRKHLRLVVVELQPMSEEESRELLYLIVDGSARRPDPPERRALVRASRGYPMALELLVQDWISNGHSCLALSFRAMTADFRLLEEPIDAYSQLLERIVVELSPSARRVLQLAAILGSRLADLTWYSLMDLSIGDIAEGVSQLTAKRIIRDVGAGLEFINELVRVRAYGLIPPSVRSALHSAVADRMVQPPASCDASGLEVAWHLIRGGRGPDAISHLLRGGRAAIDSGAPDDAVLALRSGAPWIRDSELQTDAYLLLSEAFGELGWWAESLHLTTALPQSSDTGRESLRRILQLEASWKLGDLTTNDEVRVVDEVLNLASNAVCSAVATRALVVAARIVGANRAPVLLTQVRECLDNLRSGITPGKDTARWLMAQAMVLCHLGHAEEGFRSATECSRILLACGARDSTAVSINIGLGVLRMNAGDFENALEPLGMALELAQDLENAELIAKVAANLALVSCRLCDYDNAIKNSNVALDNLRGVGRNTVDVMCCLYAKALAHAFRTDARESLASIHQGDQALTEAAPWLRQHWLLARADALWILNRVEEAALSVRRGTTGSLSTNLARSTAGKFIRWHANLARLGGGAADAIAAVQATGSVIQALDRFDQAEIAFALDVLSATSLDAHGLLSPAAARCVSDSLRLLPRATVSQIRQLSALTTN